MYNSFHYINITKYEEFWRSLFFFRFWDSPDEKRS